jgi:hypothetical protein
LARDKIAECMILERVRALFSMCMIVFFQWVDGWSVCVCVCDYETNVVVL